MNPDMRPGGSTVQSDTISPPMARLDFEDAGPAARPLSRREFGTLAASALSIPFVTPAQVPGRQEVTAGEIVERIRQAVGVEWRADTVDAFKAGDAGTAVKGIITTALPTMEVLRRTVDAGANLVLACEPTFYARADGRTPPAGRGNAPAAAADKSQPVQDSVYAAKNAFLDKHGLVVFRFSDHWRQRRPSPFAVGQARQLGWSKLQVSDDPSRYAIPAVTLETLVATIQKSLGIRGGLRVVGDPKTLVRTVALLPGSTPIAAALDTFPSVDLVIAGEVREWESVEYARDLVFSGARKGLVLLGRIVSEEGGMAECARWLTTVVPEVPVWHVTAGDPYWRPA